MENNNKLSEQKYGTIIIGAGQAGLATGYYLKQAGEDFIIIDSSVQIGDSWRQRWDTLRLFTPSQYDGLPGMKFPSERNKFPDKNEMADYLATYSKRFELPVQMGVKVNRLKINNSIFEISSSSGTYYSERVVVATGTNPLPKIPKFANELDSNILQIHSSKYRNPNSISGGDTLVVGAGTSGIEIALDISKTHKTYIAGKPTFKIPDFLFNYTGGLYWWFISNIITEKTPIGKKAKKKIIKGGSPLIRISADDLDSSGIERIPRVSGVKNGMPELEDGRVIRADNIIWSTGFKPDFSWIDLNITNGTGWPLMKRGVSETVKGLYFVGMLFQFGLTSGLIGGVGRDAKYVANYIAN
ncbi:MAG: potassium transporter Trk [Bacteroidetes bacterium]|nr:MAG: potassium transporter Trk [Bacteroidota bacterium]